jgi:hypothetical protein
MYTSFNVVIRLGIDESSAGLGTSYAVPEPIDWVG